MADKPLKLVTDSTEGLRKHTIQCKRSQGEILEDSIRKQEFGPREEVLPDYFLSFSAEPK